MGQYHVPAAISARGASGNDKDAAQWQRRHLCVFATVARDTNWFHDNRGYLLTGLLPEINQGRDSERNESHPDAPQL